MKVICEREALLAASGTAATVARQRSPKPVLQNMKLEVIDKGRIKPGQQVTWVVPGDGIELSDDRSPTSSACRLPATIADVRHLGETTLATLRLQAWPAAVIAISVSGVDQRRLVPGAPVTVGLDLAKVHVMPRHAGTG